MQLYSPRLVQNPSVKQRIRCKNGQQPLVANPSRVAQLLWRVENLATPDGVSPRPLNNIPFLWVIV